MLVVTVEVIAGPVTGLWCDRCALPSAFSILLRIGGGLRGVTRCVECG